MGTQSYTTKPGKDGLWDVVIVGSGPAGLTAAIYTTRGALSTLVLAGESWGGQLMNTTEVDNFPGFPQGVLGSDLMAKMRLQAQRFGAEIVDEKVEKVILNKKPFTVFSGNNEYLAKSLIIATGAKTQWLGVPGEKDLIGRGVSTCASCDAPFFKDKKVAVVGGGDSAMEEALVLTKYAQQVYLLHRRSEFKASEVMQKKVLAKPEIKILYNTEVCKVVGTNKLEKLIIKDNQTNQSSELVVDGLFVAIGHKPDSDLFIGQLAMDNQGFIIAKDFHCGTSVKGVFVAGDVLDKDYKQAIVSAGSGCIAAMEVIKFLDEIKD